MSADEAKAEPLEDLTEITSALGTALAQWGVVEGELYLLYLCLCRGGEYPNTYSVIYETIVHLDGKLSAIDALVRFRINNEETLAEWTALQNRTKRKIRKVRNKLAHWRIYSRNRDGKTIVFLGPPMYLPTNQVPNFGTAHGGAMFAPDLLTHAKNFSALAQDIRKFWKASYTMTF